MRVLVSGGGTGGHIYPALAIAKGLKEIEPETKILYVGTRKGLEARIVPQEGLSFSTISVEGLPRKIGLGLIRTTIKTAGGYVQARKIIKDFNPDIVIGTGGYVCGPVVLAAALKKIPTLIHEQNAFPGVTNKLLARVVDRVAVTFPESIKYFKGKEKVKVTGLPIRPEILCAEPESAEEFGFRPDGFNVLVVGGSRGARRINLAIEEVIKYYGGRSDIRFLIITGEVGYEEVMENLQKKSIDLSTYTNIMVKPYLHKMPEALSATNLILCRAGATTIAEITAKGIPGILIPYPYAAENHQEHNAMALVNKGAAIMIKDNELNGQRLINCINELISDPESLHKMRMRAKEMGRPQALKNIIELVQELI